MRTRSVSNKHIVAVVIALFSWLLAACAPPTPVPTSAPVARTTAGTAAPTAAPTVAPTVPPTSLPTSTTTPTLAPTLTPTAAPTDTPTSKPTATSTSTPSPTLTATPTWTPKPKPTRTRVPPTPTPAITLTPNSCRMWNKPVCIEAVLNGRELVVTWKAGSLPNPYETIYSATLERFGGWNPWHTSGRVLPDGAPDRGRAAIDTKDWPSGRYTFSFWRQGTEISNWASFVIP